MAQDTQFRMGLEADAVLRLGMLLMGAGAGGYRVIRGMKRAARALGFDNMDAVISVTTITCTFHRGEQFRTIVANQDSPDVDASRIEALENLTHGLQRRITVDELNGYLDEIDRGVVKRWPHWFRAVAAGVACASFAVLNRFATPEVVLVALSACAGQSVRGWMGKHKVRQLGGVAAGGVVACLVYYLIIQVLGLTGVVDPERLNVGFVAAVLFLVPGFPLFSAMIDLSRFDMDAGISRLTYALTIIITATFSVGMISWVTGMNPAPVVADPMAWWQWYPLAAVASFAGIAGFAFLFNSSRRMVLVASLVGTTANVARLALVEAGLSPYMAAFIGGLIIGGLGAVAVTTAHIPRVTSTVPAAVIMIPGPAMFRAIHALNEGLMDDAVSHAATAMMTVIAIGAGLVAARMLTDKDWAFGVYINFDKKLEPAADD